MAVIGDLIGQASTILGFISNLKNKSDASQDSKDLKRAEKRIQREINDLRKLQKKGVADDSYEIKSSKLYIESQMAIMQKIKDSQ